MRLTPAIGGSLRVLRVDRARATAARECACYQSIADTIVQLFRFQTSDVIASSQPIRSDVRNVRSFGKESLVTQFAQARESSLAHLKKVLYTAKAHTTGDGENSWAEDVTGV